MRSYLRYWLEVFRLPGMAPERDRATRPPSRRATDLHEAVSPPAAASILALPHMGNWDLAGAWVAGTGAPFTTVAERLKPESLYDRFVAYRESLGMEVLPLTGGGDRRSACCAERLRAGGLVCLLADRDLTGARRRGRASSARRPGCPPGPALLAQQTGAPLLPVDALVRRLGRHAGGSIREIRAPGDRRPRDEGPAMTQALADAFADGIAEHPEDWHMLQRLWLDDLRPADDRDGPVGRGRRA